MSGGGRPVSVIGAGFSGLVSAYYLAKAGYKVEIYEAKEKPGGLIGTIEAPLGRVETAANGLLNSALVEDLFADLGVPVQATKKEARRRYIVRDGEAWRWPLGLRGSLELARFAFNFIFRRARVVPRPQESASAWGARVMGEEAALYFVEAALQGIYAGDPSRMSASLIFGRFFKKTPAQRKPRVRGTVSTPEGMGKLIRALEEKLKTLGCAFNYGSAVEIENHPSRPTIVATSAGDASRVLHIHSPAVAHALSTVEIVPVTTATLFFDRTDPSTRGFGCLFPPVEARGALGVLKNDFIFPGRVSSDVHSETWILGGARAPRDFREWTDEKVIDLIVGERTKVFDLSDRPREAVITRWPQAIPHYTVDLEIALPTILSVENNVWLVGNYLGQIGLAKILERAERLPDEIAQNGKWT